MYFVRGCTEGVNLWGVHTAKVVMKRELASARWDTANMIRGKAAKKSANCAGSDERARRLP